jgi:hypothetical protein
VSICGNMCEAADSLRSELEQTVSPIALCNCIEPLFAVLALGNSFSALSRAQRLQSIVIRSRVARDANTLEVPAASQPSQSQQSAGLSHLFRRSFAA